MHSNIRVLEVIRQGEIGGGESHVLDLITGFNKEFITPIAMAFTNGYMIETLRNLGIKCYVIESMSAFDYKVQNKIIDIIKQENIDLIHAHGSRAASNVLLPSKLLKKPMIYTVHGWSFHPDQSIVIQKLRGLSEKLICKCSKEVICVSESNRISGNQMFGLNSCRVVENGVNFNKFNYEKDFDDCRFEFGFSEKDIIVALIARITKQKSPKSFIDGIVLAHQQDPRIKGLIIGDGDLKKEIEDYVLQNHLDNIIHLHSFRTDIPKVLNSIDIYCLPSLWEGLSIALLEAMAMKKPVIVTPTDGCKELIRHGHNGIIVSFNSPQNISDACIRYTSDVLFMKNCANNAYQMVKERFNAQRVSDEVVKIYQKTLDS